MDSPRLAGDVTTPSHAHTPDGPTAPSGTHIPDTARSPDAPTDGGTPGTTGGGSADGTPGAGRTGTDSRIGAGHLVAATDPMGNRRTLVNNAAGLPAEVTDPLGATARYERDVFGRVTAAVDALGATHRLSWTVEGKLLCEDHAGRVDRTVALRRPDNNVEHVDPLGGVTRTRQTHFDLPAPRTTPDGATYRFDYVRLELNGVAQSFPRGHRIRLSLSTSYWPLAWPAPESAEVTVYIGGSSLSPPVRSSAGEERFEPFGESEGCAPLVTTRVRPGEQRWEVRRDLVSYESVLEIVKDAGTVWFDDIGLAVTRRAEERYTSVAEDFTSVRGETAWTMRFAHRLGNPDGDPHPAHLYPDRVRPARVTGRI